MTRFLKFLWRVVVGVVKTALVALWAGLHVAVNIGVLAICVAATWPILLMGLWGLLVYLTMGAVIVVVCSPILLLMGFIELIQLIIKDPINWVEEKTGLKIR